METIRRIRDRFYEDTKGMSSDQLKTFIARKAAVARSELGEVKSSGGRQSNDSGG
jgi:hypothetical protein